MDFKFALGVSEERERERFLTPDAIRKLDRTARSQIATLTELSRLLIRPNFGQILTYLRTF